MSDETGTAEQRREVDAAWLAYAREFARMNASGANAVSGTAGITEEAIYAAMTSNVPTFGTPSFPNGTRTGCHRWDDGDDCFACGPFPLVGFGLSRAERPIAPVTRWQALRASCATEEP